MATWREITIKAEQAKRLFLQNRNAGEQEFTILLNSNPNDGMVHLKLGESYEAVQEYALASKHFHLAESFFRIPKYQEEARTGIERVGHHLQSPTPGDPFEKMKSNLPPVLLKAIQDAEKFLAEGEYEKVSIETGQTGVRSLIMYLEGNSGLYTDEGPQGRNWEKRTRDLENNQIIDSIAANQLKMVREIRNNIVNKKGVSLSPPEAKSCLDSFKSALVRIFQGKNIS